MKDELGGNVMREFVAVRAKLHSYRKIGKETEEKCWKGRKRCVVAEGLMFDDYSETIYRDQILFENKKHEVYTVNKPKMTLNRDNDNRIVQADGIATLARGHVAFSE